MEFTYLDETQFVKFPQFTSSGIVAVGGNLSPGFLLSAYLQGVFPWYNADEQITWWSPNPRFVLFPQDLHIPKSLKRFLKTNDKLSTVDKTKLTFTQNACFKKVMQNCANIIRPDQESTWIHNEMIEAYSILHEKGYAHSFETWQNDHLVGGFYGVMLGKIFFGESMFSKVANSSKAVFVKFAQSFFENGGRLIDSQVYTDHMARFGAKNISRDSYLHYVKEYTQK
ncbi:MAG: leucyl/phenylalanyl-tRNA--protein transferase [Treponema sp.]|nr:leucyl/phenylalanyl-tRNA--protein transferase [Treponema sp.]